MEVLRLLGGEQELGVDGKPEVRSTLILTQRTKETLLKMADLAKLPPGEDEERIIQVINTAVEHYRDSILQENSPRV